MKCLKGHIRLMTKICFENYGQICGGSASNQEAKGVVLLSLLTLRLINLLNAMITIVRVNAKKHFLGISSKCEGRRGWNPKLVLEISRPINFGEEWTINSPETSKCQSPKSKKLTEKFTFEVSMLGH